MLSRACKFSLKCRRRDSDTEGVAVPRRRRDVNRHQPVLVSPTEQDGGAGIPMRCVAIMKDKPPPISEPDEPTRFVTGEYVRLVLAVAGMEKNRLLLLQRGEP